VIEQQYNIEIKLSVTGCIKRCSIHLRESCNHQLAHTLGTCCPGSTSTRTSSRCSRPPLPISSQLLLPSLHHSPQQQLVGPGGCRAAIRGHELPHNSYSPPSTTHPSSSSSGPGAVAPSWWTNTALRPEGVALGRGRRLLRVLRIMAAGGGGYGCFVLAFGCVWFW
jgi:hypothetical protein